VDPGRAACTRGAAQTIITTAVASSSSPAAAVSHVDLVACAYFIVGILFPVGTPCYPR
jgi:hypothetical protein